MASKSKKKTNSNKTTKTEQSFLINEIIVWVTLALSILIFISNIGFGGSIGGMLSKVLKEAFGVLAYLTPFLLFGLVSFCISNKDNKVAYYKMIAIAVIFVCVCGMIEMISKAGGALGEFLYGLMEPALGKFGAFVVLMIITIICFVVVTEKSAIGGVKKHGNKAYDRAKISNEKLREAAREKRQAQLEARARKEAQQKKVVANSQKTANKNTKQKARTNTDNGLSLDIVKSKRVDHRIEGVSFDTTLARKSPDVVELTADYEEEIPEAAEDIQTSRDFVINRGMMPLEDDMKEELPDPFAEDNDSVDEPEGSEELPATRKTSKKRSTKEDVKAVEDETKKVEQAISEQEDKPKKEYKYPPINLLKRGKKSSGDSDAHLRETALKLENTLRSFGVNVTITNVSCGPSVTRYELQPEQGVKVSKIVSLADDIKLNLAAADIRIEAPIPGKAAVGIEVPNKENATVMLRDLLETNDFQNHASKIAFAAGRDIAGQVVVTDIAKMPHLLVAGATGSGKSVCINTLIMSILYKASPDEVKLIMIDPKVVELSVYNGIPHLMIPVVTDPKKAAGALNWAVAEMTRRYNLFAEHHVRDMKGYNAAVDKMLPDENGNRPDKMCQLVIIVDELADLMMVAPGEVEEAICRLAQLARAAGIHLILATQRPSVNVITGLIKANMPSRIAFSVTSGVDSRTIIDMNGAEKLLGKGDMLFYPSGYTKPARVQGAFVSDSEVQSVVDFLKDTNSEVSYNSEVVDHMNSNAVGGQATGASGTGSDKDAYFTEAGKFIIDKEKASIGMLQRVFKIGFNRAARIMDQLCEAGVVGPEEGTKPRKVLMSMEEFEQYIDENL